MYNQADPSAVQWYGAPDMYQQMLMRLGAYGTKGQGQQPSGGWSPQMSQDSDFQQGMAMHNNIWGDDKKQDDGMQAMLMQLLSAYGGGA